MGAHPLCSLLLLVVAVAAPEDLFTAGSHQLAAAPVVDAAMLPFSLIGQHLQLVWVLRASPGARAGLL